MDVDHAARVSDQLHAGRTRRDSRHPADQALEETTGIPGAARHPSRA